MYDDERPGRITFSERNPTRDIHREVEIRVRERMSKDAKLTHKDAARAVFAEDPFLHTQYLDNAPPLRRNTDAQE